MNRSIMAAASCGLLLATPAVLAQPRGDAGANWDAVVRCAQQSGTQARHDCIDRVLRESGVLDRQRELSEARQDFGREKRAAAQAAPAPAPAPAPTVAAVTPRPAAPPPVASAAAAPPPKLTALNTQVASARLAADRMLLITTVEGAVWRQTQMIDMRFLPERGDTLEVEQAALGSHRCKLGSKIFRCQRAN